MLLAAAFDYGAHRLRPVGVLFHEECCPYGTGWTDFIRHFSPIRSGTKFCTTPGVQ